MIHLISSVFTNLKLFIFKYGEAELYYRIVNMRDAPSQSMATIAAVNQDMYQLAPEVSSTNFQVISFVISVIALFKLFRSIVLILIFFFQT